MILLHLRVHEGQTSRLGHVVRERRDGPKASTHPVVIVFWVVWVARGADGVEVSVKGTVLDGSKTMATDEQEEEEK